MFTEDEIEVMRALIKEELMEALQHYELKRLKVLKTEGAAVRMRRLRERRDAVTSSVTSVTSSVTEPEGKRHSKRNKRHIERNSEPPTNTTWTAYSEAYQQRYGVAPTRNRMVNGQLAQYVTRVPAEDAPQIAVFFVRHNKAFYVSSKHAVGALLRDAEGLRTEWLSGRTVTDTEARQADRTQTNLNVHQHLMDTFHPEKDHEPE